ncbi:YihY family inner membrane protein [Hylemonella sp. W303a]|uniref:YihY family inner membrane protein n=1 Tax=Hylemonella sp. W303a TaxID=3389873 RepID=UPI00396B44E9
MHALVLFFSKWQRRVRAFIRGVAGFPWRATAWTLRERFREDRLGQTAGSLTFTTTIALVPLLTVALALITAFPMFAKFQDVLQKWLIESLVPENISRQVLAYISQFSRRAGRLGWTGLAVLFLTALGLIFTIDRTFNALWRVQRPRAFGQRLLVYWAAITLGPMLVMLSLLGTSYLGPTANLSPGLRLALDLFESLSAALALAAVYHYVPNTPVKWMHAWTGALLATLALEAAKRLLGFYLKAVPTYSAVYGAFATVPILLIWIYMAWVIVLLGAVITAYLPSLLAGVARRAPEPGWQFQLALEMVRALSSARQSADHGLTLMQLSRKLRVDPLQLEPLAEVLERLNWVGRLAGGMRGEPMRLVLLIDPDRALLAPLVDALLLPRRAGLWRKTKLDELNLRDALTAAR